MKSILVAASVLAIVSSAAADQPESVVETATNEAISYLDDGELAPGEAERLLSYVDVDAVARFALGQYARQVDEAEYAEYRAALDGYLRGQLQSHLARLAGGEVTIGNVVERGEDQAVVETEVTASDGEELDVNWRLRQNGCRLGDHRCRGDGVVARHRAACAVRGRA